VRPPKLYAARVPYPPVAKMAGVVGAERLLVDAGARGRVVRAKVLGGPGQGLDQAAAAALRKFRFQPARDHAGRAVPVRIVYSYIFRIDR
jgi:protein TonB